MEAFSVLVILHIIVGTIGLVAFWVPISTKKGAKNHRNGGKLCCYGFIAAGALAVAMAVLSIIDTTRHPEILDRDLYLGLFGWMMLYLGILTIGFADYGLAVVRHSREREKLRGWRYQGVMAVVVISGAYCGYYGYLIGNALMMALSILGIASMAIQQVFVWRSATPSPKTYIGEHFRALIGMGISAYTAFMSVGLIRVVPEHVFNPLIWAGPSVIGVSLIIWFTHQGKKQTKRTASGKQSAMRA
ncbi:MAG: hypothetical protein WBA51_10795 [Erythrobacter sp.]